VATLNISIDETELSDLKRSLSTKQLRDARFSAIGETVRHLRTHISKEVRKELNIKKKDLDPIITIKRGTNDGEVTIKRKAIRLKDFSGGVRQVEGGVRVKVRKRGGSETLRGAFVIVRFGGGVFERVVRGTHRTLRSSRGQKRVRRWRAQERYGPTVLGVIEGKPGFLSTLLVYASEFLNKRFRSKLEYIHSGGRVGRNPQVVSEPSE
jgi:hypothetical protein